MREHSDARVALAQLLDIVCGEFFMHLAATLPSDDTHTGQSCDVLRQVLVGNEYDFRHAKALHHFLRVGRSTADIALRLHIRAGIDIGDHGDAGVQKAQAAHVRAGDRLGQRTSGFRVGDQYDALWIQKLGGFRHEVNAAQHNHLGAAVHGLAGEGERITDDIRHPMEDFRGLVVVSEDDGIAFAFQTQDRIDIHRIARPFERRHHTPHALVDVRRPAGDGRIDPGEYIFSGLHATPLILTFRINRGQKTQRRG